MWPEYKNKHGRAGNRENMNQNLDILGRIVTIETKKTHTHTHTHTHKHNHIHIYTHTLTKQIIILTNHAGMFHDCLQMLLLSNGHTLGVCVCVCVSVVYL